MTTAYHERPSQILRVNDEWAAYQFDMAVLMFGRYVESKTADGKTPLAALLDDTVKPYRSVRQTRGIKVRKVKKLPWE